MEKFLFAICGFIFVLASLGAAVPGMQIHIKTKDGVLNPKENLHHPRWVKKNQERYLDGRQNGSFLQWGTATFSFVPEKTGQVSISLKGTSADPLQWVLVDNVKVNGSLVVNGDFENGLAEWKTSSWGKDPLPPRLIEDPSVVRYGKKCALVRHNSTVVYTLDVEAGKPVMLELLFRPTDDYTVRKEDLMLPLAKVANRSFSDDKANDGKGGWSDQGPENDLHMFDRGRHRFSGISFNFPAQGNAVVVFDGKRLKSGISSVTLDVPADSHKRFLYLLHTACWCPKTGMVGTITFTGTDGTSKQIPVEAGRDIRDWWKVSELANAVPVWKTEDSANKGLYLSKFEVPAGPLKSITFTTAGNAVWILCGATLSSHEPTLVQPFRPGSDYKAGDIAPKPTTLAGSALDLSAVREPLSGRVVIGRDGILEQETKPGQAVRFRAIYHYTKHKVIQQTPREELHRMIDAFLLEARLRGYNMVRTHGIDGTVINLGKDHQPSPQAVDAMDYFIASAQKQGFYINLNIAAYYLQYCWETMHKIKAEELKAKILLGDPEIRQAWIDTAKHFLCRRNPYSGTMLKDDPKLIMVEPYNELAFGLTRSNGPTPDRMVFEKFQAYLDKKFGRHVEDAPPMPAADPRKYQTEWYEFHYNCIRDTMQFFRDELAKMGVKTPVGQYNVAWGRQHGDVRSEFCDIIIKNTYFSHPSLYMKPGSLCVQNSAVQTAGGYFRKTSAARIADRPMVVTEYNHAFWNSYEYEQPLFAAYAAFQGYSALTMHHVRMNPEWDPVKDFASSLMDRSCEILAFLLFQRGDVTPSKQLIELSVPKSSLFAAGAVDAISQEQTRAALLTRFAVKYEATPRPKQIEKLPESKPVMVIPLQGGSVVKQSKMFVEEQNDPQSGFDFAALVKDLKAKGILAGNNRTDAKRGIYESDTGELFLNAPEKLMTVRTANSELVTSEAPTVESLPCLRSVRSGIPSTVAVSSIDGKALVDSERMLFFYLTAVANTGLELSGDRMTLRKTGHLPVLIRTSELKVVLRLAPAKGYTLYPLRSDGLRRAGIPLKLKDGLWELALNTAKLPNGPTFCFELVAQK